MDAHVKICEELFSASRTEFKHLESLLNNLIYESVWKDNRRRMAERLPTLEIPTSIRVTIRSSLSVTLPWHPMRLARGWSVEHWNEEPGAAWMGRFSEIYDKVMAESNAPRDLGVLIIGDDDSGIGWRKYVPLTIKGLEEGMSQLSK